MLDARTTKLNLVNASALVGRWLHSHPAGWKNDARTEGCETRSVPVCRTIAAFSSLAAILPLFSESDDRSGSETQRFARRFATEPTASEGIRAAKAIRSREPDIHRTCSRADVPRPAATRRPLIHCQPSEPAPPKQISSHGRAAGRSSTRLPIRPRSHINPPPHASFPPRDFQPPD